MPGNVRYADYSGSHKPPTTAPTRAKSLDCLADKTPAHEYIPSRITRTTPKINEAAMQFVKPPRNMGLLLYQQSKTGPAELYKSATEQIKKAEVVKAMRKHLIAEEEEWQQQPSSSSSSSSKSPFDEEGDWQSNLDKWKSSRRKRNEEALERVIEIKKNEQEEEMTRTRRKSKTFSEMQEDKTKRGRRYNLVVHNDDNNDLADLGLSSTKSTSSLPDAHEETDVKDIDQDNKDAKSDAGFCTGSDTGSDGVFAEDNISDTSSALGDKKDAHDSLLDPGVSKEVESHINGHGSGLTSEVVHVVAATILNEEYTYDKAIEGYKQYAENSAKKRTSSITSLNSNTSYTKDDERKEEKARLNGRSPSPNKSSKLEEKLTFFSKEMEKEFRTSPEPRVIMREKSPKVDVGKRRSMFEMGEAVTVQTEREQKNANRRSLDMSGSLKNKVASFENLESDAPRVRGITPTLETNLRSKVASFENLDTESTKVRGVTPVRDSKFKEKLATFNASEPEPQSLKKNTPERDVNFYKKLASFTSIENGEEEKSQERKTIPPRDPMLRNKIASFEQLEQSTEIQNSGVHEQSFKNRDRSVSLEHLHDPKIKEVMRSTVSVGNMGLLRRAPSTPYMVVDVENTGVEEVCFRQTRPVVSAQEDAVNAQDPAKRSTIYETIEKCQVTRDVESAPMYSIFQYLSPEVNAQVFEIASKLEETPLVDSPILKAPTDPLPQLPTESNDDSLEGAKSYSDGDVNEVLCDYEEVRGSYEESPIPVENIYENITEEPMYENIYEKVDGDYHSEGEEIKDEPHYQTLEEVREEVHTHVEESSFLSKSSSVLASTTNQSPPPPRPPSPQQPSPRPPSLPTPQIPLKPLTDDVPEVLDVTWTDGPSQAAPPSEPPPPPPPDDDSDNDASDQLPNLRAQEEDAPFTRENSTRRIKKELWRRRSDFLGTSSQYIEEEPSVKPPPDLSDLLRQERDADRGMGDSQMKSPSSEEVLTEAEIERREREIIENLERSEQLQQQQRPRYLWEDRMREDEENAETNQDIDEHVNYHEAKNGQTSSESDTALGAGVMQPVTSVDIPHTSNSVPKTSELEFNNMGSNYPADTPKTSCTVLDSNVFVEETRTESLETYVNEAQTVVEVAPQPPVKVSVQNQIGVDVKKHDESLEEQPDRMMATSSPLDRTIDSVTSADSQLDHYKELAELEEEMKRHDQDMLLRAGKLSSDSTPQSSKSQMMHIPPPTPYASQEESSEHSANTSTDVESNMYSFKKPSPNLPIQEFYTAPSYDSADSSSPVGMFVNNKAEDQKKVTPPMGSPSQYSTLASPHPFSRSHSQSNITTPVHPPLHGVRSSPLISPRESIPEPLPRKKKLPPPPTLSKPNQLASNLNTAERLEAIRLSRMPLSETLKTESNQTESQSSSVSSSGQQMSKQTLLALSAIPKPKLTDNESWITKKKPEQRKDYSKHWLLQEAEQRRLEQHDRLGRQKAPTPPHSQSLSSQNASVQHHSPQHTSPSQPKSFPAQNVVSYPPQNTTPTYSTYPQALKNPSPSHNNNANIISNNNNNNNNNSWRNQATTYQPSMPTPTLNSDKALPDSIIHNLTQRVNNKNNKNTYTNNNGRMGSNYGYRDENYHDYMNADALSAAPPHAPLYQSASSSSQPSPPSSQSQQTEQQDPSSNQDQRLLSVSGKKKCSHCSEELGRGAAMIIESLRLFYHIPCFKCCVCGIQLGNGSAGADVRVRNHKLHCHNCYSNDEGMKFSKV